MKLLDKDVLSVTGDVTWVGIRDYDIETFDIVMTTEYGTTYNSYFINSEKKAVIEVAKEKFSERYLDKLRSVTDLAEIEYIILDHTEPDHSGSLAKLLEFAPEATVVGSGNAIRYLSDMFSIPFKSLIVKDGDTLDLGNKKLKFITAPNLHWPDSIYTYLVEDRLLFTCDSFGAHYCSAEMFDDKLGDYSDSFKYYFDVILKPFSKFILKAIEKIRPLEIEMICPGHGPILRSTWKEKVDISEEYATEYIVATGVKPDRKVLVSYVSAYGYTKKMASFIARGLEENKGVIAELVDIETIPLGELDSKLIESSAILAGSPTINQNTLLPVYRLFALINPLRDKGKLAGSFGSYGWSGEAPQIISGVFKSLKLDFFDEPAAHKFAPGNEKEEALVEYGRAFGKRVLEKCGY